MRPFEKIRDKLNLGSTISIEYGIVFLIVILNILIYHQLSTHDFISLDDHVYVTGNDQVKSGLTLESIKWAFTTMHAEFWHPVTWLSLMVDTELYGVDAGGYLITNLFLHIANSLTIFFCFKSMAGRLWPSALPAFLFAVHPLHVENVAWISDRKDLLGGLFWILTTWQYYRYVKKPAPARKSLLVVLFGLGLMSKPVLVSLPCILILLDIWPLQRFAVGPYNTRQWFNLFRQALRDKLLLFAMALAFGLIAFWAQQKGGGVGSYAAYPVCDRVFNAAAAYIGYLLKTVWPANLAVFYPFDNDIPVVQGALAILSVLAISVAAWRWRKCAKPFFVGWFWFLITLIPTIGIIKIGDFAMADRYMYIPQIGLFIVFSWGIYQVGTRWANPIAVGVACSLIIGLLAFTSYHQVKHWRNSRSLFAHALEVNPNNYFAHYAMGRIWANQGEYDRALDHFSCAVDLASGRQYMKIDLGRALIVKARFKEALEVLEPLISLNPSHLRGEMHFLIGLALMGMGRYGEAESHFIEALDDDSGEYAANNKVADKSDPGGTIDREKIHFEVKKEASQVASLAKKGYAKWRLEQVKMDKNKNGNE